MDFIQEGTYNPLHIHSKHTLKYDTKSEKPNCKLHIAAKFLHNISTNISERKKIVLLNHENLGLYKSKFYVNTE